jgi:osmoprotectant transport system permease protein
MKFKKGNQTNTLRLLINWLFVPLSVLIALILLYQLVLRPIPPASMEENIIGSTAIGFSNIYRAIGEHLQLVLISTTLSIFTGIAAGVMITREGFKDFAGFILALANFGQSVPSIAVLALFMGILGLGARTAIFALWLYALLPIIRNTATGIEGVAPNIIEAAAGMGMTRRQILFEVELPLAFPVIFAGIRTAVILNIGTAALGSFIGAGGLGDFIITGIPMRRDSMVMVGAVLTAILAILADWILEKIQNTLVVTHQRPG